MEKKATKLKDDHSAWLEFKETQEFRQAAAQKVFNTCHVIEESRAKLHAAVLCNYESEGINAVLSENGLRVLNMIADCASTSLEIGNRKSLGNRGTLPLIMAYGSAVLQKIADNALWSWVPATELKTFQIVAPFKRAVLELMDEFLSARATARNHQRLQ